MAVSRMGDSLAEAISSIRFTASSESALGSPRGAEGPRKARAGSLSKMPHSFRKEKRPRREESLRDIVVRA